MELSDLNVFSEVASSGGITSAAQKLNRVPSNVTARIQKLEEELGTSLFLREKNRLRISPSGEQLLPYAHKILALSQQAVNELQHSQPRGELSIGSMEAVAATRLSEPLMHFHKLHPDVNLQVSTAPTGRLIQQVLSGELNMALVADPAEDKRLHIEPAFKEELVMVSDLAHKAIKHPKGINPQTSLLGFNHLCAYRTRLTDWVRQEGGLANVVEISSYHALLSCVAAGMGVGIVPKGLLEHYPFAKNIKVHKLPKKWGDTSTAMIWRKDSIKPSIEAFSCCVLGNEQPNQA